MAFFFKEVKYALSMSVKHYTILFLNILPSQGKSCALNSIGEKCIKTKVGTDFEV